MPTRLFQAKSRSVLRWTFYLSSSSSYYLIVTCWGVGTEGVKVSYPECTCRTYVKQKHAKQQGAGGSARWARIPRACEGRPGPKCFLHRLRNRGFQFDRSEVQMGPLESYSHLVLGCWNMYLVTSLTLLNKPKTTSSRTVKQILQMPVMGKKGTKPSETSSWFLGCGKSPSTRFNTQKLLAERICLPPWHKFPVNTTESVAISQVKCSSRAEPPTFIPKVAPVWPKDFLMRLLLIKSSHHRSELAPKSQPWGFMCFWPRLSFALMPLCLVLYWCFRHFCRIYRAISVAWNGLIPGSMGPIWQRTEKEERER